MSKFISSDLPFWVTDKNSPSFDVSKRKIYLPSSKRISETRVVHQEIKRLSTKINLGGFDKNGNNWPSRKSTKLL